MDWESLRRPKKSEQSRNDRTGEPVMRITPKKVAVKPEDLIKLPDGTVIVKERRNKE